MKTLSISSESHARMRARRVAAGLCLRCKSTVAPGRKYCQQHLDLFKVQNKRYATENPEIIRASRQRTSRKIAQSRRAYQKRYAAEHKQEIAAYKRSIRTIEAERKKSPAYKATRNAWRQNKKREDPAWAMADRIRKRIGRAIRDYAPGMKLRRTQELIGCSMDDLMRHIESQFLPGMTWENRHLWHIDHIRPCALFNLTDPEEQRRCFHYTNLQPLWAVDNIRKWCRYGPSAG